MMKQNTNIMYELFYTFIVVIILIAISFVIKEAAWYLFIMAIALVGIERKICQNIEYDEYELFSKLF